MIGEEGDGPLQFSAPCQVYIAPDDFVFVADRDNNRVQVLTPTLDFHSFVGVGVLQYPAGVCVNADVVVVSEADAHRISVFNRRDGTLLRRFGSEGSGDGQLHMPLGLCFMSGDRCVAVIDYVNSRVSVFTIDGLFVRHVGAGVLSYPRGVACSAFDELVVADDGNRRVVAFTAGSDTLKTMGIDFFCGIALNGGAVFAQDFDFRRCVVFT
jgi:DNA-binding beta-propeller fold protein YncE